MSDPFKMELRNSSMGANDWPSSDLKSRMLWLLNRERLFLQASTITISPDATTKPIPGMQVQLAPGSYQIEFSCVIDPDATDPIVGDMDLTVLFDGLAAATEVGWYRYTGRAVGTGALSQIVTGVFTFSPVSLGTLNTVATAADTDPGLLEVNMKYHSPGASVLSVEIGLGDNATGGEVAVYSGTLRVTRLG